MSIILQKAKNIFSEAKEWIKVGFITIGIVILSKFIATIFTHLLIFLES
nr:hypothetical protein [uncultured Lachnoclostridium sp.]